MTDEKSVPWLCGVEVWLATPCKSKAGLVSPAFLFQHLWGFNLVVKLPSDLFSISPVHLHSQLV
jgi:hypothetical protein